VTNEINHQNILVSYDNVSKFSKWFINTFFIDIIEWIEKKGLRQKFKDWVKWNGWFRRLATFKKKNQTIIFFINEKWKYGLILKVADEMAVLLRKCTEWI
jgi:hypothetical protein